METRAYQNLGLMAALHFVIMYAIMYAMVDTFDHVYPNLNTFYMAGMMTVPMIVLEVFLMPEMYRRKAWNGIAVSLALALLILFWFFTREQTAIGDREFLRSMIPHHSGAILMCEEAELDNPEIRELCRQIIENQKTEIRQMENLLKKITS